MPEFALPRTAVVVRLQLTHGAPRTGEICKRTTTAVRGSANSGI